MRVILATGSRELTDVALVYSTMAFYAPDYVIHGAHHSGLDKLVEDWCYANKVRQLPVPAQWKKYGPRAAGPIRNGHMVISAVGYATLGAEVIVVAFPLPGSRGTIDCMNQARMAGLQVVEIRR